MSKTQKKVETYKVIVLTKGENDFKFEDIISADEVNERFFGVKGKYVSFKILENTDLYVVGIVETYRNNSVPPKRNHKLKKFAKIGLTDDESLAYGNVFIYEKKRKILMYETNGSGCIVDHFLIYLFMCCKSKKSKFKDFDIKLNEALNANEYKRMLNMSMHKTLEIEVANPTELLKVYKHKNDAFFNFLNFGKKIQSGVFTLKYDIKLDRGKKSETTGLASQAMKEMVDNILEVSRTPQGELIEKLMVVGYEENSPTKLSAIDLIGDRYIKYIELDEPMQNADLLEGQRKAQIIELYKTSSPELDKIFGKK